MVSVEYADFRITIVNLSFVLHLWPSCHGGQSGWLDGASLVLYYQLGS